MFIIINIAGKKIMIYNRLRDFRLCGVRRVKNHFAVPAENQ